LKHARRTEDKKELEKRTARKDAIKNLDKAKKWP
jgi:hypothetical protein